MSSRRKYRRDGQRLAMYMTQKTKKQENEKVLDKSLKMRYYKQADSRSGAPEKAEMFLEN